MRIARLLSISALTVFAALPSQAADQAALENQILADLRPLVETLDRDILTFSYAHREAMDSPAKVAGYIPSAVKKFWDLKQPKTEVYAGGFYLAIDPIMTMSYGGDNFALFITPLRKGMRYLNLPHQGQWPKAVVTALKAAGCPDTGERTDSLMMNHHRECREIALSVLKKLDIDAIGYFFDSYLPSLCNTSLERGKDTVAFVMLRESAIRLDDVKVLTNQIPTPDPYREMRLAIEGFGRDDPAVLDAVGDTPWPDMVVEPNASGTRAWEKLNLFACDKR